MYTSQPKIQNSEYSAIYKTPEWQREQHDFEMRLGNYTNTHPKSHKAINKALSRMKNVLCTYYCDQFVTLGNTEFALNAFTKDDPSSAGQVGRMVGDGIFKIIGDKFTKEIDDNLSGSSGNLREKMTAFYNAAYYNSSDRSKEDSAKAINFKNIMQKIVTSDNNISNQLISDLSLDETSVKEIKSQSSKNIFKTEFLSGLHNIFSGPDVYSCPVMAFNSKDSSDSYVKNFFRYKSRNHKGDSENIYNQNSSNTKLDPNASGIRPKDYQDKMGLKRSERELAFQEHAISQYNQYNLDNYIMYNPKTLYETYKFQTIFTERSPIKSGKFVRYIVDNSPLSDTNKLTCNSGFSLIAGMSGTTGRMLNTVKWLGFHDEDLINFRLALMGWMLPEEDHSLYEILTGSHMVGVRGKEDLTDSDTMDKTVDPLSEYEIRENCGANYINKYNKHHGYLLPIESYHLRQCHPDSVQETSTYSESSTPTTDYLQHVSGYSGRVYSGQKVSTTYRPKNAIVSSTPTVTNRKKPHPDDCYKNTLLIFDLYNTIVDIRDSNPDQILIPSGSKFKVKKVETDSENKSAKNSLKVKYVYLESFNNDLNKPSNHSLVSLNSFKYNSSNILPNEFHESI